MAVTNRGIRMGELRHVLVFERDATVRGTSGGAKAWATPEEVCTVRGLLVPRFGREDFGNPEVLSSHGQFFAWIRWRTDLDEKMRIKWTEPSSGTVHYYQLRSVPALDRAQVFVRLECEEVV